jgi:hypothetical protein
VPRCRISATKRRDGSTVRESIRRPTPSAWIWTNNVDV